MADTVTIYGASDDLIEIEGALREEFNYRYDSKGEFLAFSDGTLLTVEYGAKGLWRINRIAVGDAAYEKHEATDEDKDYSDRVTLTGDLRWVVHGIAMTKAKS